MKFKKFNSQEIVQNHCTMGIIPESFLPTLNFVAMSVTIDVVTDIDEEGFISERYAIIILKNDAYENRRTILEKYDEWFPAGGFPSAQIWKKTKNGWACLDYNHWDSIDHKNFFKTIVSDNKHILESTI